MYDVIIVGQGIAGSVLAYTLLSQEKNVLVIDNNNINSCSSVAAGLFNPVTGKRMVRTWNATKLFPFFHSFYREMEKTIDTNFFHPMTIYRPFGSIEEQNHWMSKSGEEEAFVKVEAEFDRKLKSYVSNAFGGFETNFSGWVDVKAMIFGLKKYLMDRNSFQEAEFSFDDLTLQESNVTWKNISAKQILFCEGYRAMDNPYFKWIPYSPSKGEVIIVKIDSFPTDVIINKNMFIVPLGEGIYKVGATFDRTTENQITEKGKAELIERLQNLIKVPFEILDHQSGIRPSVPDRRPLIGLHPDNNQLGLFNGLGTKGISLSPYYAKQFVEFLDDTGDLDPEVNIQRYYSLYYGFKG